MNYIRFALREKRILSFGFSFTFFSSFGQTFLISLFVPFFLQDFTLTHAAFGSMYSVATLISAGTLPYLGKWIDHISLRKYSMMVATGLLIASLTLAFSWHIGLLFAGVLMLRVLGQGLSTHTAQTAMARSFEQQRGKALSISGLGYPIGEGVLPLIIAGLLSIFSWRQTWGIIVLVIALVFLPLIWFMLRNYEEPATKNTGADTKTRESTWELYQTLLYDYKFWLVMPSVLLPAFWATGLFLYQVSIAGQLGWSATLIASAFTAFAASRVMSTLLIGPAIDRWSAKQIFPFYLLPFAAGLMFAFYHPGNWTAFIYMLLMGATMGMGSNIKSSLWAELYGTEVLGTVRSLFSSLMVFSTAVSPFLMGWALDHEVSMESILIIAVITVCAGTLMAFSAFRDDPDESPISA